MIVNNWSHNIFSLTHELDWEISQAHKLDRRKEKIISLPISRKVHENV